jgi:hypothetical protein
VVALCKLSTLRSSDWWLLAYTSALLVVSRRLLAADRYTIRQVTRWLRRTSRYVPPRRSRPPLSRLAWAIDASTAHLPGEWNCLPRALVAHTLCERWDYDATMQIGVAQSDEDDIDAHAWVEHDGAIVVGEIPDLERYSLLPLSGGIDP